MSISTLVPHFEEIFLKLKTQRPLVHNITNFVVMNTTANALLAIGASPIMAHSQKELFDLLEHAKALVINIGTLDDYWIECMHKAAIIAYKKKIPIVLDPVGVHASSFRLNTAKELLPYASILKGNASEITALSGLSLKGQGQGVDSYEDKSHDLNDLKTLSLLRKDFPHLTICCSGVQDSIFSPEGHFQVENGHPMMAFVTGSGCTLSAICAAFSAVTPQKLGHACLLATLSLGVAAEIALYEKRSAGPASLQINMIDALYQLTAIDLKEKGKCHELSNTACY